MRPRRAADLEACERLQRPTARAARELLVPELEVGDGIERDRSGEQTWMLPEEQKGLLAAHAPAHRVDALGVDSQPGTRRPEEGGHASEVVDLAAPAPGMKR